jgi:cysteine desulfurase / selenocysteine lyase
MRTSRRDFLQNLPAATLLAASTPPFSGNGAVPEQIAIPMKAGSLDLRVLRAEFPALEQQVNGHPLAYLDSAATTQRPRAVIQALADFYSSDNANPAPTLHTLARRCASRYEDARQTVARFVNARGPEEIVWTRGTTEAINLVTSSWGTAHLRAGDEIVLTVSEHYSNLLPWQLAAQRAGVRLRFVDIEENGRLRVEQLDSLLSARTKLVALPHVSNVLGLINPIREICDRAHRSSALVLVDGAQSVPHFPVDVRELGCDFFAFSGHKMMGPMGIGVLWARREILEKMPPYQMGSNMVHDVEVNSLPTQFAEGCLKFGAGTPNVAGAVGLAAAVKFVESIGREQLWTAEQKSTEYALSRLSEIKGLRILGPKEPKGRVSVFSFVLENLPALDIVKALDAQGIAVRGGDLAALPVLKRLGVPAAVRASCYLYTTTAEVDRLAQAVQDLPR